MNGKLLPTQVINAGKTPACLSKVPYPEGWYLCYTGNHWSNEDTMMGYLHNILLPNAFHGLKLFELLSSTPKHWNVYGNDYTIKNYLKQ